MTRLMVSQLRPDALSRIERLVAGRVSFLLDSDVRAYPVRHFVGTTLPAIPYLQLTICKLSAFHARTLQDELTAADTPASIENTPANSGALTQPTRGLSADAYSLNDLAFPNPQSAAVGLYHSGNTVALLAAAPAEWQAATGVTVEPPARGRSQAQRVVTGSWLRADSLANYSSKYSRLVADLIGMLRAGHGKIMIYHHRVHMSGVVLVGEILRMNGFADEYGEVTEETLCTICGLARRLHKSASTPGTPGTSTRTSTSMSASTPGTSTSTSTSTSARHEFAAARFTLAHSDIDRAEMLRSIARFNAPSNSTGEQIRVLIGSKVIREGLNFRSVRHLLVASMPTDYPTLLQVFGRVVRKESHRELPKAERNVTIRIYVGSLGDGAPLTPELQRYADKGQEFLVIQRVERALQAGAVDGYANYERVRAALGSENGSASIDALPYTPLLSPARALELAPVSLTFDAYGHAAHLIAATTEVCRALFSARPVWTYPDLLAAARSGAVRGSGVDPEAFTEECFAAALRGMIRGRAAGGPPIVRAGAYYIQCAHYERSGAAAPLIDVENWLRNSAGAPSAQHVSISISDYVRKSRTGKNFDIHLRSFEKTYLGGNRALELSLVELSGEFHMELLRRLIAGPGRVTADDERLAGLYRRYRIGISAAAAAAARSDSSSGRDGAGRESAGRDSAGRENSQRLVGYCTSAGTVALYDKAARRWYSAPLADFKYGHRHNENSIVVGFVTALDAGAGARFKLRPSLAQLRQNHRGAAIDIRTIVRGAVCDTRPREQLDAQVKRLRAALLREAPSRARDATTKLAAARPHLADGEADVAAMRAAPDDWTDAAAIAFTFVDEQWPMSFAARYDRARGKRFPSANELCEAIRLYLLALEEHARNGPNGMMNGVRWLYLFPDRTPSISALGSA